MLVTRRSDSLVLVTQPSHAALAGRLAEHWGNEQFRTPAPDEALICAATHHDDGWLELDARPAFNAEQRRPAHFIELPLTETAGPYARGVESVYARDVHAGVLVSMHFSGFYTSRWGVGSGPASENPLALEVVGAQEARWMPALRQAWGNRGRRSEFDASTWHAYEVLQALDLMSLGLCRMELDSAAGEDALDVTSTLARVELLPGGRTVTGVPLAAGGPYVSITAVAVGGGIVELDPYPLGTPEVDLLIPARDLPDRSYSSAEEASRAFAEAPVRELALTLTARR